VYHPIDAGEGNILEFWLRRLRDAKMSSRLARLEYEGVVAAAKPVSNSSIEGRFSRARALLGDYRQRMDPETLEALILGENPDLGHPAIRTIVQRWLIGRQQKLGALLASAPIAVRTDGARLRDRGDLTGRSSADTPPAWQFMREERENFMAELDARGEVFEIAPEGLPDPEPVLLREAEEAGEIEQLFATCNFEELIGGAEAPQPDDDGTDGDDAYSEDESD
jgi:hypothetical protein